jgi:Ras-related protein Rab-11B
LGFSVIGDSGVGKTCILNRLTNKSFDRTQDATMGVEFFTKTFHVNGAGFKFQFWDGSGQERFLSSRNTHYLGATLFILVYDINEPESFAHLERWLEEIRWERVYEDTGSNDNNVFFGTEYSENALVYLIGNKSDLDHMRKVPFEEAQQFADRHCMQYYEMSAKSGDGIKSGFDEMVAHLARSDDAARQNGGPGICRMLDFHLSSDFEESPTGEGYPWMDYRDETRSFSPLRRMCSMCCRNTIF